MKLKKGKKYLLYNIILLCFLLLSMLIDNLNINNSLEYVLVSKVIDGDTIEVISNNNNYRVRLIGVDTPEINKKDNIDGLLAKKYTESKLLNNYVYLEKDVSETDRYGRLLRYIWVDKPTNKSDYEIRNKMFNAKLLLDGFAVISTYQPDVKYIDYFKMYNSEARINNYGLWSKE
jgi:micrococcal nuclease